MYYLEIELQYTKVDDNNGKMAGKINNIKTFDGGSKPDVDIPEHNVSGTNNALAATFTGENS